VLEVVVPDAVDGTTEEEVLSMKRDRLSRVD
jgi:hypothetical protein